MADITILCESKYIEWEIQNFFEQPTEVGYKLDSACFSLSETEWYLRMYPNGQIDCSGWIGLYLRRKASEKVDRVTYRIGIKSTNGTEFQAEDIIHTFENTVNDVGRGYCKFLEKSKLLSFQKDVAPGGNLTVFCRLQVNNKQFTSSTVEAASQTHPDGTVALSQDLKDLLYSRRHADVTITVKDKEFRAHTNILASRSPVFEAMFSHDMEEKHNGKVDIIDCDQDTFEDFLIFMYTGKLDSVSINNAVSLYRTSDKYDVKELKDECVRCMVDELSNDAFCDVLQLATMQDEKDLLKAVTDYFINNAETIIITTKWQTFLGDHHILGNELFLKFIKSKANIEK